MSADFLTDAQVKALSARASEVVRLHCEARFASIGAGFGSTLFNTCRKSWGKGLTQPLLAFAQKRLITSYNLGNIAIILAAYSYKRRQKVSCRSI